MSNIFKVCGDLVNRKGLLSTVVEELESNLPFDRILLLLVCVFIHVETSNGLFLVNVGQALPKGLLEHDLVGTVPKGYIISPPAKITYYSQSASTHRLIHCSDLSALALVVAI